MLHEQMLPWQLESVLDVPRNLPVKFHQNQVSNSWDIAKLSSSWLVKWLVELRLALSSIITTPTTHPHPPGKVEMQLEIDHIYGQWVAGG